MQNFIEKANHMYGFKYDYSKVNYINSKTEVIIICPEHGEFLRRPDYHLQKHECKQCKKNCNKECKKLSLPDFIEKARIVHGLKYDYSKVNYINSYTKVTIICPEHGEFSQRPYDHFKKRGCLKCFRSKNRLTNESFIEKARIVHGLKYDYSKVNYIDFSKKITIICPEHGEFLQTPSNHLRANNCKRCVYDGNKLTTQNFIEKSKQIHGTKYDYSKVNYVNNYTKVTIICPVHGEFLLRPASHLQVHGCKKCNID